MRGIGEHVVEMEAVGRRHKSDAPFFQFLWLLQLPLLYEDVVFGVLSLTYCSFLPLEELLKPGNLLKN